MANSVCRGCQATVRWIEMESGKRFPVDPVPTPRTGSVAARLVGDRYVSGYVVTLRRPLRDGFTLFDPHYRVCRMDGTRRSPGPRASAREALF